MDMKAEFLLGPPPAEPDRSPGRSQASCLSWRGRKKRWTSADLCLIRGCRATGRSFGLISCLVQSLLLCDLGGQSVCVEFWVRVRVMVSLCS